MDKKTDLNALTQFHDNNIYPPGRLILLDGDINSECSAQFISNIRSLDYLGNEDITVLLKTEGGEVHEGMAIFDAIKECDSKVIVHAVGICWSMGAIILQAGDKRLISENATLMVHEGDLSIPESHKSNAERWIKEYERLDKLTDKLLLDKIRIKHPRFTKKKLKEMLIFDTILTAEQAIELGLADEIAEHKEF